MYSEEQMLTQEKGVGDKRFSFASTTRHLAEGVGDNRTGVMCRRDKSKCVAFVTDPFFGCGLLLSDAETREDAAEQIL